MAVHVARGAARAECNTSPGWGCGRINKVGDLDGRRRVPAGLGSREPKLNAISLLTPLVTHPLNMFVESLNCARLLLNTHAVLLFP